MKKTESVRRMHRQSNIELLRIVSMFFVLILHANFYAIGLSEVQNDIIPLSVMSFIQEFSDVGVNVFILISGYFGIHTSRRGILNFVFQCLFYSCGIYILFLGLGIIDISVLGISECFYLRKINWFPKAYLCLYILSPVLNIFVEYATKRQFQIVLISYFIFQTIFGCISEATYFLSLGWSAMSFIGLYLLARYVRMYPNRLFLQPAKIDFFIYCIISVVLSLLAIFFINKGLFVVYWRLNAYANPLVIISALYLFLCFSKIKIQSSIINKIASSCFAVYLLHANPNITERFYTSTIKTIFDNTSGFSSIIYILLFLIVVYILAILVDQIRIFCWNNLLKIVNNK